MQSIRTTTRHLHILSSHFLFYTPSFLRHPLRTLCRFTSIVPSPFVDTPSLSPTISQPLLNDLPPSRLNPHPDDFNSPTWADSAHLTLRAGPGGHGCVAFLREAYMPNGPPNGGDGGTGGNIYIQAVPGETSLYKLSKQTVIKAGRGKHGRGKGQAGARGEDVVITVPVGTVVREVRRWDPAGDEEARMKVLIRQAKVRRRQERELDAAEKAAAEKGILYIRPTLPEIEDPLEVEKTRFVTYPGLLRPDQKNLMFPRLPKRQRLYAQPPPGIHLDLSEPTPRPILLVAGGIGGLGNPHFQNRDHPRPMIATKGEEAVALEVALELKLLADVGLVGLPNAGKSTLLRLISNSRTRVGNWAFTTLQPNIGTVVLDNYRGRLPAGAASVVTQGGRTRFTVADIPGLVAGAHLDRGLGISFLKHVERARVLAFVVDLAAGEEKAVECLKGLWREVALYARMKDKEAVERAVDRRIDWSLTSVTGTDGDGREETGADLPSVGSSLASLSAVEEIGRKPWFVVGTKGDLEGTRENFAELSEYLNKVGRGEVEHPGGLEGGWRERVRGIPISAIKGHGMRAIVDWTVELLK